LTSEEIEELTLRQWEALEIRRTARVNQARYNAGLPTAMLYNANCGPDAERLTAFDFVPGFQMSEEERLEEKRINSLKHSVRLVFGKICYHPEKVKEQRPKLLEKLKAANVPDAEDFILEVFSGGRRH
jgi:hypothetical protein